MNNVMNWGILGCGGIAGKFARSVRAVDGAQLVAVASRTEGKAENFAKQRDVPFAYVSYEELVQRDDITAVYVANTHNFHYECVKLALEHNKAVLCEKPFTVNAWEAEQLVLLARARGLFLMEAMWTRFLPAMGQIRTWLAAGAIGDIKQVRADFGFYAPRNPEGRLFNPALAGGALLDAGIYPVSFASMVMQKQPESITAVAQIGETGVDEQTFCLFRYANEAFGVLTTAIQAPLANRAEIIGTEGTILVPELFLAAQRVELITPGEQIIKRFPFPAPQGFKFEIEEVLRCVQNGETESRIMPLDETLALMHTLDRIREQLGLRYANDQHAQEGME